MTDDDLIRSLVADLRPVRRLASVDSRTARWVVLAVSCVCAGSLALGTRADLAPKLHEPVYLAENGVLLLASLFSAKNAFHLSVPGVERSALARTAPIAALLAWVLLIAEPWSHLAHPLAGGAPSAGGWACVWRMIGLSLAPALPIFFMLRTGAPRERGWIGLFAALSASALAAVGTQVVCMKDDPEHILRWHFAPLLAAALMGIGAGRLLLWSPEGTPIGAVRPASGATRRGAG